LPPGGEATYRPALRSRKGAVLHRPLVALVLLAAGTGNGCSDAPTAPEPNDQRANDAASPSAAADAANSDGRPQTPRTDLDATPISADGGTRAQDAGKGDAANGDAVDAAGLDASSSGDADSGRDPDAGRSDAAGSGTRDGGCALELEGFATLAAEGQNGTFGGRDGQTVTVTSQAELEQYATATAPFTIRVQGAITLMPKGTEIRVASHKTIIGVGATAAILQGGFMLEPGVHNVILRNLTISGAFVEGDWEGKTNDFDAVQMDTAHHVWIDHCHFHHMGDGLIDSRKDTTYLTVSWSVFSDHNKTFGIGWTESVSSQITIHHNVFRDVNQRVPSVDNVLRAHLYNNWLLRVAAYGNYARGGTNMVLQNSVFDRVADPHYADTGSLVASGNIYRNASGQRETAGSVFFAPSALYPYKLDPADKLEALLERCAGPRAELGL
jgi:pectate lyase